MNGEKYILYVQNLPIFKKYLCCIYVLVVYLSICNVFSYSF